jgi:hypothetical protein
MAPSLRRASASGNQDVDLIVHVPQWRKGEATMIGVRGSVLAVMVSVFALVPSAGCASCEVDCSAPLVLAYLKGLPDASSAELCIDDHCETIPAGPVNGADPVDLGVVRFFEGTDVREGDTFAIHLDVRDASGKSIATFDDTRRFAEPGSCTCLSFQYRWNGKGFDKIV